MRARSAMDLWVWGLFFLGFGAVKGRHRCGKLKGIVALHVSGAGWHGNRVPAPKMGRLVAAAAANVVPR